MHNRAVVIWAVEIVCHLFLEVMNVFCWKHMVVSENIFLKLKKSTQGILHPNLVWCFSIQLWRSGLGLSGTAHVQSQEHAWTHARPHLTTYTQDSVVTWPGFLQSAPERTSTLENRTNIIQQCRTHNGRMYVHVYKDSERCVSCDGHM